MRLGRAAPSGVIPLRQALVLAASALSLAGCVAPARTLDAYVRGVLPA